MPLDHSLTLMLSFQGLFDPPSLLPFKLCDGRSVLRVWNPIMCLMSRKEPKWCVECCEGDTDRIADMACLTVLRMFLSPDF